MVGIGLVSSHQLKKKLKKQLHRVQINRLQKIGYKNWLGKISYKKLKNENIRRNQNIKGELKKKLNSLIE